MSRDSILGPQAPLADTWFDRTQIARAKILGEACPAIPPTDTEAQVIKFDGNLTTSFNFLHYYDLPLCEHIAYKRSTDPVLLTLFRKCADSWWLHPQWVNEGKIRLWLQGVVSPPPRHAGIGGLILRALDGRSEMWDWINAYSRFHFDHWVKKRIGSSSLFYGVREGAFALHYATWLAVAHPDSTIRATYLADVQAAATGYYGKLQQADGSWRWDDFDTKDADGGTLKGITQPFMVGLLLCALVDVHQIATDPAAKEDIKNQILRGCRHLYSGGPYRKDDPVPYDANVKWRCFWYLYHGGTTINPTKFERGGWSLPGINANEISDARQSIGPVIAAYGYAYKISGDPFFKTAGDELWDAAYGGSDGIRNLFAADGKSYNQNARRAGSYLVWAGQPTVPPSPSPTPTPVTPSSDGTRAATITDLQGGVWTIGPQKETLRNGIHMGGGRLSTVDSLPYKWLGGIVYAHAVDNNWWSWKDKWVLFGAKEPMPIAPPLPVKEEYVIKTLDSVDAARTKLLQEMWAQGYGAWEETKGVIKFRLFPKT